MIALGRLPVALAGQQPVEAHFCISCGHFVGGGKLTVVIPKPWAQVMQMNSLAKPGARLTGQSAVVAAFFLLPARAASACSMANEELARWDSVVVSGYYWIASMVLGSIIVGVVVYHRRWLWSPLVVAFLLVFHPTWTLAPAHGPDCSFQNVEASRALLVLIGLLLAYQIFSIWLSSRKAPSSLEAG